MNRYSFLFLLLVFSCNDGDIITGTIEFGDTFNSCGELVFYKINSDTNESLSFQITNPTFTVDELFETTADATNPALVELTDPNPEGLAVTETGNILNYRSYSETPNNIFCNDVQQGSTDITQDFKSTTGLASFIITLEEDDNDGIPPELEDDNTDNDNNYLTNPLDTDGDGLPNYLDPDDDGDNVLTIDENPGYDDTTNTLIAQDTDNDDIPDYLDTDDDGDTVLTINEETASANQNPLDDISDAAVGPDYLNNQQTGSVDATAYREHAINQEFTLTLLFSDITFPNIIYNSLSFGNLDSDLTSKIRTYTPDF
jgi:hypothetical protein